MAKTLTFFLLICLTIPVWAGETGTPSFKVHEQVVAVYNFEPHALSHEETELKSKVLDAFWDQVKGGGAGSLQALRTELQRTDSPVFFNYDGAKLLLSLSQADSDKKIALTAIARANLRDIQPDDYFYTIHRFAVDELDTSGAAFKILDDPDFSMYVPQHALTLEQDYCLLYLLLPTKEEFYLDKAIARLGKETNDMAFKSLLHLIAATVTKKGDAAIRQYANDQNHPKKLLEIAATVRDSTKAMAEASLQGSSLNSYASLKEEQRKLMARVSDEALDELDSIELQLRHKGPD